MSKQLSSVERAKITRARVLVVGAGVLGNAVIWELVQKGSRCITIVDNDRVERRNVDASRFFTIGDAVSNKLKVNAIKETLKKLVPDMIIEPISQDIEDMPESFFKEFDVVLGCVDNLEARLHINAHCYYFGIPYVDGGIDGQFGRVQVVLPPGACLQCGMNSTHRRELRRRYSCSGGERLLRRRPTISDTITTNATASLQVKKALNIILTEKPDSKNNNLYYFELKSKEIPITLPIDPVCILHNENSYAGKVVSKE